MKKLTIPALAKTTLAGFAAAVTLLAAASAFAGTGWIHGGNWADVDANISNIHHWAGLDSTTTPAEATNVTDSVVNDCKSVGINFVRVAINPATVSSSYWSIIQDCINEMVAKGMTVDIGCWYCSPLDNTGVITNMTLWENMWRTVDGVYKSNNSVYYEPINEPAGYSLSGLEGVYTTFLGIIQKSQSHIILDGTGFSDNVTGIGGDSAFNSCLLSLHIYPGWGGCTSEAQYESYLANTVVKSYYPRTVITEMGATTTSGKDYTHPNNSDNEISLIRGVVAQCKTWGMGFTYWPSHIHVAGNGTMSNFRLFNGPGLALTNESIMLEMQVAYGPMCRPAAISAGPVFSLRNTLTAGNTDNTFHYGASGDIPVMGDWDGNGSMNPGVVRNNNGQWEWLLRNSNSSGSADIDFIYGSVVAGDIPIVGDWDGNGTFTPGIVRINANGQLEWLLRNSNSAGSANLDFFYGITNDIVVTGDWDGNRTFTPGILRGTTWHLRNSNTAGGGDIVFAYGQTGDVPIVGDWDGNGTWTCGVVRTNNWLLRNANSAGGADISFIYGNAGDDFQVWR